MAPGAPWDPPWAYLALILNLGVHFGAHFGTPKEAKFDQKLTFCQKGCSEKCIFIEFCGKCRFSLFFCRFLVDFHAKIDVFSMCCFARFSFFVQPGKPHETLYFTVFRAFFSFFIFRFFAEKRVKNRLRKGMSKKHPKVTPSGTQKWPK